MKHLYWDRFYKSKNFNPYLYNAGYTTIRNSMDPSQEDIILELGCGTGLFVPHLLKEEKMEIFPVCSYVGLDYSQVAIDIARHKQNLFEFHRRDIMTMNWDEVPYDMVVAINFLNCIEPSDILSHLRPGTPIFLTVCDYPDPAHIWLAPSEKAVEVAIGEWVKIEKVAEMMTPDKGMIWVIIGKIKSLGGEEE